MDHGFWNESHTERRSLKEYFINFTRKKVFIIAALALGIQAAPSTPADLETRCGPSAAPVDKRACDFYYAAEVEKRCGASATPVDKRVCDLYFAADIEKRSDIETRCGPFAGPLEKRICDEYQSEVEKRCECCRRSTPVAAKRACDTYFAALEEDE